MNQTLIYPARVGTKVRSAGGKYQVSSWKVGDRIIASGDRLGRVSSIDKKITITWENGLSAEYTPKQMQAWNYRKSSEDEEATECNSYNLTSAQELVQDSASLGCNSDLTLLEPQRLTNTAQASSNCDIQELTTTETCEKSPGLQNADSDTICTQEQLISSQLLHLAPHSPQKANGLEQMTKEIVSPQSLNPSQSCSQNSQQLKTSPVCSLVPTEKEMSAVTSGMFYSSFPPAGMMRTGLLSEADTVPLPSLESGYCWLPSPGALSSTGKGRPPGQTKQEGGLKDLGLLQKGEVLNPDILCEWYRLPQNWLDPLECRAAAQLLENNERQQEICLTPELPALPFVESSTSTPCVENQPPLTRANAKAGTYIIDRSEKLGVIRENLGFGFVVEWFDSQFTYNWERDDRLISKLALAQPAAGIAPQFLIDKFLEDKSEPLVLCPSCELQEIYLTGGCGICGLEPMERTQQFKVGDESFLGDRQKDNLGENGLSQPTPENFLEENECSSFLAQQPKPSKQKGCLYKYLENKKLKDGTIASYPRVIGDRKPDNPTHWRWGFNWEEKIDGEWKGRSIGSIPVGAIALIQSMQNEGVSLEEIIDFLRRAKAKKC